MQYQTFAQLYDDLFDPDLYQDWFQFSIAQGGLSKKTRLLDLAGGAGRFGVLAAQTGAQTTVFDLSEEMLGLAQKHADEQSVPLTLIHGDMTNWPQTAGIYDLITCFADSLNYLPDEALLQQTFAEVYRHLDADGVFLFDMITPYKVAHYYADYYYNNDDDPEHIFMWTSYPDVETNSVDHDLKFFLYNTSIDGFKLVREVHHEQTYPLEAIQKALQAVGFTQIEVSDGFGQQAISETTQRWFFKVTKA